MNASPPGGDERDWATGCHAQGHWPPWAFRPGMEAESRFWEHGHRSGAKGASHLLASGRVWGTMGLFRLP